MRAPGAGRMHATESRRGEGRRHFLRVLGGGAAAMMCPLACSSSEPDAKVDSGQAGASGDADATGGFGGGGTGGGGTGGGGASPVDAGRDVALPPCVDPPLNVAGCEPSPPGRVVGAPCDFAAFRLQAAPHDDLFQAALIGRDAGGWYARSAVCTHMGCNLAVPEALTAFGIACPCHGSAFDHHGQVLTGPAVQDLRPVALALDCDGKLHVDLDVTVTPELRLKF